jgi:Domain of unknown function (DUF4397)
MREISKAVPGLIAALALLAGCSSSDDDPPDTADVRFIHASPDAPSVNVEGQSSTLVAGLAYKSASPFRAFDVGTLNVRVDGIVPGGTATVIGPVDLTLAADTSYSVIALGEVAAIDALVIADPATMVAAGQVRAHVVHAAPNAPAVDVYVTAPGADLTQSAPLGSFAFGEDLGPVDVAAGDYEIRVTLPANPASVVFDSGTVSLPAGADLLITAVENTGPGAAPVSLVVADGEGSFEILDAATPAALRVIHASPDAPSVDVIVNDDFANPVLAGVPFPAFSDYLEVPAGTYNVKVTPAGNPGVIVIDADLDLEAGSASSVYASGLLASIAPYVLADDDRSIATEAKVRIVHMAPSAGLVDLYVTAPGADISTLAPTFAGVDFKAETGYVALPGGNYEVTVTVAGTKTAAIGPAAVTFSDGGVYTAAARDAPGGGAPFGLILLDDFNP